MIFRTTW